MSSTTPAAESPGRLADLLTLTKLRITFATSLTAGAGFLLAAGHFQWQMLPPLLGTFLLASGASALNHLQDVRLDARMTRTSSRPLPSGRMDRSTVAFITGILLLLGFYFLSSVEGKAAELCALGALAVVWYNGVYTYLKRLTAFAAVPGALIGAVPPAIGWVAGGGQWGDPLLLILAGFFFVWQIPHFWLLLLLHGDEYHEAGLPSLTALFSRAQLLRITFMWVLATAAAGMAFPALARETVAWVWGLVMAGASLWLSLKALELLRDPGEAGWRVCFQAFTRINVYALLVILCLCLAALFGGRPV